MMRLPTDYLRMAAIVLICGGLAACVGKPIDPDQIGQADEIPPGPGLISGEKGQFEVTF